MNTNEEKSTKKKVLKGDKAYELYKRGKDAWNKWAEEHKGWTVDFRARTFEEDIDFVDFIFQGNTNFDKAKFEGNTNFINAILKGGSSF